MFAKDNFTTLNFDFLAKIQGNEVIILVSELKIDKLLKMAQNVQILAKYTIENNCSVCSEKASIRSYLFEAKISCLLIAFANETTPKKRS